EGASEAGSGGAGKPLRPLDPQLVRESLAYLSPHHLLDARGRWGRMQSSVWGAFLEWLSQSGLLTTKVPSRKAQQPQQQGSGQSGAVAEAGSIGTDSVGADSSSGGSGTDNSGSSLITSLDGLRSGDVGERIPREAVDVG
ncbi:hypothetical protein Agub_g14406, partial [Astrephomene gubernaculifera]